MKALVAYYSRTGNTRKVAERISALLGCDIEEIRDVVNRSGMIGWLKAGRDVGSKRLTTLETVKNDPAGYDIIVIGTPIWRHTLSTPIRTYISQYQENFKKVSFFCTGRSTGDSPFDEMESLCGKKPIATLRLQIRRGVDTAHDPEKIQDFISKIKAE
jgi:flavodoxin